MAQGDSQEVVFGIFHAAGGDALSSVEYLKQVDALAQTAYEIDVSLVGSEMCIRDSLLSADET